MGLYRPAQPKPVAGSTAALFEEMVKLSIVVGSAVPLLSLPKLLYLRLLVD